MCDQALGPFEAECLASLRKALRMHAHHNSIAMFMNWPYLFAAAATAPSSV